MSFFRSSGRFCLISFDFPVQCRPYFIAAPVRRSEAGPARKLPPAAKKMRLTARRFGGRSVIHPARLSGYPVSGCTSLTLPFAGLMNLLDQQESCPLLAGGGRRFSSDRETRSSDPCCFL